MRRWIAAVALAGATALLATGCTSLPAGVDANLSDDWQDPPAPKGWSPAANECQSSAFTETLYLTSYAPISCTQQHRTETVHVGTFDSTVSGYPARGSAEFRAAYAACEAETTEFLGGHWQDGKLWIGVTLPSADAWTGGSRWYKCEVVQLDEMWGDAVGRSTSLKGALTSDATVRYGCQSYKSGSGFSTVACGSKHNAEFVGNYFGVTAYSKLKNDDAMAAACRGVIAKYVGLANDGNMKYRTGVIWDYPSESEWNAGDHGVRCWLWLSKKTVSRSLKGTGNSGLPIN